MDGHEHHDRAYLQSRVREELARSRRYGREFALITLEARPSTDSVPIRKRLEQAMEVLEPRLRPSDVVGRAFEDTIVLLLVETGPQGAHDVLIRIRSKLLGMGVWELTVLTFPADDGRFEELPLLMAA
jgi:GGDEF domain-containing protein